MFIFKLDVINSPVPALRTVVAERTRVRIVVTAPRFEFPPWCFYI